MANATMYQTTDLVCVALGPQSIDSSTWCVSVASIALLIQELGKRAVGTASYSPRLVDWLPRVGPLLGHKAIHAAVEIREYKSMFVQELDNARILPIAASSGPFNEYTGAD